MVLLYRRPQDPWADEIEAALSDMVIAFDTETIEPGHAPPDDVPALPALRDDGRVITGKAALRDHLSSLRDLMADWNRFQSDACHVDETGTVC